MAAMYEVTGYDRQTGRLAAFYDVPARRVSSIKKIASVPPSDDGLGAYPLAPDQVSEIAKVLATPIDNHELDYFLEAYHESGDRRAPGARSCS